MTTIGAEATLMHRLEEVRRLCPDMRFGQLLAIVAMFGEDSTGRSLWEIEDDEFAAAVERFATDRSRRSQRV